MKFVLDSSVIGKLFISEDYSDEAVEIIDRSHTGDIELLASELVVYEVGNIIYKNLLNRKSNGRKYIEQFYNLNINLIPINQKMACDVIDLAVEKKITYYDSVHVNLARSHKTVLVTEDKELLRKFKYTQTIRRALKGIELL
jgi:predicted nucleic acid-binding protein